MNDGDWEALRGSYRESKGDPDTEHAAAAADPGPTGAGLREIDEVIVGWRVWELALLPGRSPNDKTSPLILKSTFMTNDWPPGKIMTACCGKNFLRHGMHAFATRDQTQEYIRDGLKPRRRYIFGEVSLWGRVVIHEHGYRAAYAYPKRLFIPEKYRGGRDYVNELRRSYGVEVEWSA
jgi:hypothetical protein